MKGRVHKKGLALVLALAFAAQGLGAGRLLSGPLIPTHIQGRHSEGLLS